MTPNQLRNKALKRDLEVEDIIEAARERDSGVLEMLKQLKAELRWPDTNITNEGLTVPFGKWADTACCFIERGYSGLVELAVENNRPSSFAPFCLAFLEEYKTTESINALMSLLSVADSRQFPEFSKELTTALNLVLSFKGAPAVTSDQAKRIREFLYKQLEISESIPEKAAAMCALRGVGNEESIKLIEQHEQLPDPWRDTQSVVIRAIRKQLKTKA